MDNFEFLKDVNKNLFNIAQEAEKLFRDEYFEQSMIQTRRFGECLCREIIGQKTGINETFDNMLATLKDTPNPSEPEKEFLDDLYFIKKAGNISAHSSSTKNDASAGKTALECLERAFEASLNYAVYKCGADKDLLNRVFDEQLLMTGKKSKTATLQEKYTAKQKEIFKQKEENTLKQPKTKKKKSKKTNIELYEEYLDMKNESLKKFREKPIWREILETILAGIIIYVVYLLIFTK